MTDNYKDLFKYDRIEKAKQVLLELFDVDIFFLENNTNRKREVIEARRFLIYYLNRQLKIPYHHLKKHIKGLHHATAIYQCRRLEELIKIEKPLRNTYNKFLVLANDFDVLETLLTIKRQQANYLNREIYALNNNLKEKRNENNSKSAKDFRAANRHF
tara:strand:+ start:213 stop:686 length:474 start_codon:yes stop_codon:yes gene_type:complete